MMQQQVVAPCLMCDTPVHFDRSNWDALGEEAIALCAKCAPMVDTGRIPWPMVRMVFLMRCQISHLLGEKDVMKRHVKQLFDAQKELEQELVRK
jgi:hypothetical protein